MPPDLITEDIDSQEIFSTGLWNKDQYSEGDLDGMVEAFGKVGFKPPIKLGHSETQKLLKGEGLPAAGWVENLRRAGDKLVCDFKRVPKKIAELIKAGAWRKKSAEVYWDHLDEADSTKFPRVLKAVSLLGEDIPAVTNLGDILALYKKLPAGPPHAYEEDGREFRAYYMDGAVPMSPGMGLSDYLLRYPRKSKESAGYQESDGGQEKCGNCKFWIPGYAACSIVEGNIEPNYVSDYFELRSDLVATMAKEEEKKKIKEYTVEKRGDQWCLISKSDGKTLGCHDTEEGAMAQEQAIQANKHVQEEGNMTFKTHMTRDEIANICAPCGKKMEEKGISALTFTSEQVAKFAEHEDMEKCMAKADMVEKYPDENDRKTACGKVMGEAVMQAIQEIKGGPIMDEKKFQEEQARLVAEKDAAEKKAKQYQGELDALKASNEEAKSKESEALKEVKKLKRERYDDQTSAWIAARKREGKI